MVGKIWWMRDSAEEGEQERCVQEMAWVRVDKRQQVRDGR